MSPPDPQHYDIEIADSQDCLSIDCERLHDIAAGTLRLEQIRAAEISIALIDNEQIHTLNRQYLNHDYATDVLSFLLECEADAPGVDAVSPATASPLGAGKRISGEVILSVEMAMQTAADYDWSPQDELVLYLVHGLLHLCGYDDHEDSDREAMRARERAVLQSWNLMPHYEVTDSGSAR